MQMQARGFFNFEFSALWKLLKIALFAPMQESAPPINAVQKVDCGQSMVLAIKQYKENGPVTQHQTPLKKSLIDVALAATHAPAHSSLCENHLRKFRIAALLSLDQCSKQKLIYPLVVQGSRIGQRS